MSVQKYFNDIKLMDKKIKKLIKENKIHKFFNTISDVGSLKVGNESFSVLIPNGYGDGNMEVYITSKNINLSENDGFLYFTLMEGKINIFEYDCGEEILFTTEEGKYQIFYGNNMVILNKIQELE